MNSKGLDNPILFFSHRDESIRKVYKIDVDADPFENTKEYYREPTTGIF